VSAGVPLRRDGRFPRVLHEPPAELDLVGPQLGDDAEVDVRRPRLRRAGRRHVRLVVAPLTLAIIGAGPFGLAQAAWAADAGVDYAIIGHPMEFWRAHMPAGMLLRSTAEWHLDPAGEWTIDRFFAEEGGVPSGPLSRERYLE